MTRSAAYPVRRATPVVVAAALAAMLLRPAPAAAQTAVDLTRRGYEPVEQTVGDVDPLRVSLRQLQTGIGPEGQDSIVFRRSDQPDGRFYVVTQGLTVSYDRSEYLHLRNRDGERGVFMLVPPNTVYHIGPPPAIARPEPPNPNRIDDRIDNRPIANAPASVVAPQTPDSILDQQRIDQLTRWVNYRRVRDSAQLGALAAFDRTVASVQ